MAVTKPCKSCKEVKPLDNMSFSLNKNVKDGFSNTCKLCVNTRLRNRYHSDVDTFRERGAWRMVKYRYGLDKEQYDKMLEEQNYVCAICGEQEKHRDVARLSIDHSHETGEVRGLLCKGCNALIGLADDSVDHLVSAINYLRKYEKKG